MITESFTFRSKDEKETIRWENKLASGCRNHFTGLLHQMAKTLVANETV